MDTWFTPFFLIQASDQWCHDEEDETAAALGLFLGCAILPRLCQNELRREHRRYLTRPDLLPNPRINTPWQALHGSRNDRAFITTMGLNVDTFEYILNEGGFKNRWNDWTITNTRNDVNPDGVPRPERRSLDSAGALGLVLHYFKLSSSMREVSLQLIFALTPSTVSRYLDRAQDILLETLEEMPEASITMPEGVDEFTSLNNLIVARHPHLTGGCASIDGLSLGVEEAADRELENATYNAWKAKHCINNVIVFSPEGLIILAVLNSPGSWHDSRVARPIFQYMRENVPAGFYVCADSGFPKGDAQNAAWIRAPLKQNDRVPNDPVLQRQALDFNRDLVSYRQTAEWGMRTLQGSFGRLRVPLPIKSSKDRQRLLLTCCYLTNVRARRVGISQIRNVYMPVWRASEDDRLWDRLGDMMFGEIRNKERVARFHLVLDEN
ncbi:hypothetical protein D9611_012339 [Ephemerocybe angulata]|uniref:DDE Tnp4 domain-containing protein n=1 Tax=Ephemerocybe angulata TaxID=980116 RepID=A0A8H5FKD8_9AGAR|nr:hypothetical protein D9611_012339 [Tulosesus angulatus]